MSCVIWRLLCALTDVFLCIAAVAVAVSVAVAVAVAVAVECATRFLVCKVGDAAAAAL